MSTTRINVVFIIAGAAALAVTGAVFWPLWVLLPDVLAAVFGLLVGGVVGNYAGHMATLYVRKRR